MAKSATKVRQCKRCTRFFADARKHAKECRKAKPKPLPPHKWHKHRPGRKPNRGKGWRKIVKLNLDHCEICSKSERVTGARIHRDHILPFRFVLLYNLGDPNAEENLICICDSCHGKKKLIEDRIFAGDVLGFVSGLNALHWPLARIKQAFDFYRLRWPLPGLVA